MCPKCGSDNVMNFWNDEGTVEKYLCHECGNIWDKEEEDD